MIHITQLLCPQRHYILAAAWDESHTSAQETEEALMLKFKDKVNSRAMNPYCGLCRSEILHCETGRTRYTTMEEALPALKAIEREQLLVAIAAASKCG